MKARINPIVEVTMTNTDKYFSVIKPKETKVKRNYIKEMCRISPDFYKELTSTDELGRYYLYYDARRDIETAAYNEFKKLLNKPTTINQEGDLEEVSWLGVDLLIAEIQEVLLDILREEEEEKIENNILKHWLDMGKNTDEDYIRINHVIESTYDGNCFEELSIRRKNYYFESNNKLGSVKFMDKTVRKGKPMNLLKLIGYLAGIKEIREIVYNNDHGVVVRDPERNNYPEKVVINTIMDIILDGISVANVKEKELALMYLDSSPKDSLAGKVNKLLPNLEFEPNMDKEGIMISASGLWEQYLSVICKEGGERPPMWESVNNCVTNIHRITRNAIKEIENA